MSKFILPMVTPLAFLFTIVQLFAQVPSEKDILLAEDKPKAINNQAVFEKAVKKAAEAVADEKKDEKAKAADEAADEAKEKPAQKKDDEAKEGEEKKTEEATEKKKKANNNPLNQLINRLFKPNTPVETTTETKEDPNKRDSRIPSDPKKITVWKRIQELGTQKKWNEAAELAVALLDQPDDTVIRDQEGRWVSLRWQVQRWLYSSGPELLAEYRLRTETVARQDLEEAQKTLEPTKFSDVAGKYFATEAGQEAANILGTSHFDRGEFALALRWFSELWRIQADVSKNSTWRAKLYVSARQMGDAEILKELDGHLAGSEFAAGGAPTSLEQFKTGLPSFSSPQEAELSEWRQHYGSSRRTASMKSGEPLLIARWFVPVTDSRPLEKQITYLQEDLDDLGIPSIPSSTPLLVGDKVIFRSLRGVKAIDARSGRRLWSTIDNLSAEKLAQTETQPQYYNYMFGAMMYNSYGNANEGEHHALAHLLFRNGNYGVTSSDGVRLFVVEDQPVLGMNPNQYYGGDPPEVDLHGRSLNSNRLAAYDLKTGRPIWEVGGPKLDEPFEPALAGTFFFGAPLVVGSDLYLIGEQENEVRLYALDAVSGALKWQQLLAYSNVKLHMDVVRQWWLSPVATSDGILICPTTVGWATAVDRRSRQLLWAFRFDSSNGPNGQREQLGMRMMMNGGEEQPVAQATSLSTAWTAIPPMISGQKVLMAPIESNQLFCVNLHDGKLSWKKDKGTAYYVAGIFDDLVVLVGSTGVEAVNLSDGKTAWTAPLTDSDGRPSGRGVAATGKYFLPLTAGSIWSIDLKTGAIAAKYYLPDDQLEEQRREIGNLGFYQGMLISQHARGITAFEQRGAIEAEIKERLGKDPKDAFALLKQAEIHLLQRQHTESLSVLRNVDLPRMNDEEKSKYYRLLVSNLNALIRTDFSKGDEYLAELQQLTAERPEFQANLRQIEIERHLARKEMVVAFDKLMSVSSESDPEMILTPDRRIEMTPEVWLAGQIQALWQGVPDADREQINQKITERVTASLTADQATLIRHLNLFRFHPSSHQLRVKLLEQFLASDEKGKAELMILQMIEEPGTTHLGLARYAQALTAWGLGDDAKAILARLGSEFPGTTLEDGTPVADFIAKADAGIPAETLSSVNLDWKVESLHPFRAGMNYNYENRPELYSGGDGLPYFRKHQLEYWPNDQRLILTDVTKGQPLWMVSLRLRDGYSDQSPSYKFQGHLTTIHFNGNIYLISLLEKKILWDHASEGRGNANNYYYAQFRPVQEQMWKVRNSGNWFNRNQNQINNGQLRALLTTPYEVVYVNRRKLFSVDLLSGKVRWSRRVPGHVQSIHGDSKVLYAMQTDLSKTAVIETMTGGTFGNAELKTLVSNAKDFVGRMILTNPGQDPQNKTATLELIDPLKTEKVWSQGVDINAWVGNISHDQYLIVDPSGSVKRLWLRSGKSEEVAKVDPKDFKNPNTVHAWKDYDSIYLCASRRVNNQYYWGSNIPTLQLNGSLHSFDRSTGKLRWSKELKTQSLTFERLDHSPALIFVGRTYVRKGNNGHWTSDVLLVDKFTGKTLYERSVPSYNDYQQITINHTKRYIELRGYNERIRLLAETPTAMVTPMSPAPGPNPAPEAGKTPPAGQNPESKPGENADPIFPKAEQTTSPKNADPKPK